MLLLELQLKMGIGIFYTMFEAVFGYKQFLTTLNYFRRLYTTFSFT